MFKLQRMQSPTVSPMTVDAGDENAAVGATKPTPMVHRPPSFLARGLEKLTRNRSNNSFPLDRSDSSMSASTATGTKKKKKKARINTRKNKIHAIPCRRELEADKADLWYSNEERQKMLEAAGIMVVFSTSVREYVSSCAAHHQSMMLLQQPTKSTKRPDTAIRNSSKPTLQIPAMLQQGFNHGYRGLELHSEGGVQRHLMATNAVRKLVHAQHKLPAIPHKQRAAPDSNATATLAKFSMKLSRQSKDWALLLAQLDLAAVQYDFEQPCDSDDDD
jgi:hypothetical protein